MELPEALREYFTLAPISAKDLGIREVNGERVSPSQLLYPSLKVIPMGWSHAPPTALATWSKKSAHRGL